MFHLPVTKQKRFRLKKKKKLDSPEDSPEKESPIAEKEEDKIVEVKTVGSSTYHIQKPINSEIFQHPFFSFEGAHVGWGVSKNLKNVHNLSHSVKDFASGRLSKNMSLESSQIIRSVPHRAFDFSSKKQSTLFHSPSETQMNNNHPAQHQQNYKPQNLEFKKVSIVKKNKTSDSTMATRRKFQQLVNMQYLAQDLRFMESRDFVRVGHIMFE